MFNNNSQSCQVSSQKIINNYWKVIISDDDESIHQVTKLVLKYFQYEHKKLKFISAFTIAETLLALKEHPDCAVLLQDMVMETNDSGLFIIKQIRNKIKNSDIRIILRTGHAGTRKNKRLTQ